MKTYNITNAVSGLGLGLYGGATEAEALDAMARVAGYRDYEHCCDVVPDGSDELIVEEVDVGNSGEVAT
jgi:hypothetical protein